MTKRTSSWRPVFLDFISHMTIQSKELPADQPAALADVLYRCQWHFLDEICDGLENGIHRFTCLKARQLGVSTISLAVDVFWLTIHAGTQGALVTDTEPNRDSFRSIIESYILALPPGLRVGIKRHNRTQLLLNNGSKLDYLVAGQRGTNRTLGQSRALNFLHCTEVGSYGSYEGMASLFASLAEKNPNRLYLFESTAHGKNLFCDLWEAAKENPLTQRAIFCGWWMKEDFAIPRSDPRFDHYWKGTYDDAERDMMEAVYHGYGHKISVEQMMWHRDKRANDIPDDDLMDQNFPATEEVAFIVTGKSFFSQKRIVDNKEFLKATPAPMKGYRYYLGDTFLQTAYESVTSAGQADLRVWDEPAETADAIYVIGVDPAYGRSENKDGHAIEVWRCFADRIVQVAEYVTTEPESYQVAWVMCHLAGLYKNVWINLELNGSGQAIMGQLRELRQLLSSPMVQQEMQQHQISAEIFNTVRWYLYRRPDAPGPGYVFNWKTNQSNKHLIFNQMRDYYHTNLVYVRSLPLLHEMERVVQDGDFIGGQGKNKDDRVFATALALKTWRDWVRPTMLASNETYDMVMRRESARAHSPNTTMVGHVVKDFFRQQEMARSEREEMQAWGQ